MQSFTSEFKAWEKGEINLPDLPLNDFEFSNRARCALKSREPATSAFVLLQNMDVARGMYRLALATGNDTSSLTRMGVQIFRYGVVQLIEHIHNLLMEGKLPLLPPDVKNRYTPDVFKKINGKCLPGEYCDELDAYLEKIWKVANIDSEIFSFDDYKNIDNFNLRKNFINKSFSNQKFVCTYLKKFSALQPHLYGTKPNAKVFEQIAKTSINREEYVADCNDFDAQKNIKVGAFQIELGSFKRKKWNKVGFGYWNSLKLYFSWAWRNAPQVDKMTAPFSEFLKSVAIEDAVYIVPNGCGSLTPPRCDGDYLALNTLRKFAKKSFKKNALKLDVLKEIPEGPQQDLLDEEFPKVNTDILGLASFEDAPKWLDNFRDNVANSRVQMKRKLLSAVNHLNVVTNSLKVEEIIKGIDESFKSVGLDVDGNIKEIEIGSEKKDFIKNELYYLCGEFIQAANPDFGMVKGTLDILKNTTIIDNIAGPLSSNKTNEFYRYYEQLAGVINEGCMALNQHNIWDDSFKADKSGHARWYIDKVFNGKFKSNASEKFQKALDFEKPLLSFKGVSENQSFEDVVCVNSAHCARKTLASIVDMHAVAQYANTFWSMDQKVKTPALFNPYAERTQCKIYDPWFKTKQIIFGFFSNLGQAALSAFVPGPIFADLSLKPGRVISFKQLVKEGKIHYDIDYKKPSIFNGIVADFGKLVGIPCKLNISRQIHDPYEYLAFSGISVSGCYHRDRGNITVYTPSEVEDNTKPPLSTCATCALNFQSVSNSLTAVSSFAPYAGAALMFLNGMVNLANGLLDPHNIPRDWKANPNYILDTFRRFGEIPKKCVRRLYRGKQCLGNRKEEKINALLKEATGTNIISYRPYVGGAELKVHGCDEIIKVDYLIKRVTLPSECSFLKKEGPLVPYDKYPVPDFKPDPRPVVTEIPEPEVEKPVVTEIPEPEVDKPVVTEKPEIPDNRPVVVVVKPSTDGRVEPEISPLEVMPFGRGECSVYTNIHGEQYVYIFNLRIKGVKATGTDDARWGLKAKESYTKPLYRAWSGEEMLVIRNQRMVLSPGEKTFKIVPLKGVGKVIEVPLTGCTF